MEVRVAVLAGERKEGHVGDAVLLHDALDEGGVLAEAAGPRGGGHHVQEQLVTAPAPLEVFQQAARHELQRQALLAQGVALAALEDLLVGRRQAGAADAQAAEHGAHGLRVETAHGREQQVHPGVKERVRLSARVDDPLVAVVEARGGEAPQGARRDGRPALLHFPTGLHDVEEGLDPRLQARIGHVAVELQGERGFAAHDVPKISEEKRVGPAGEVRDVAAEELRVALHEACRLENGLPRRPVHLLVDRLVIGGEHVDGDDADAPRGELPGDPHVGLGDEGIVGAPEDDDGKRGRIGLEAPRGPCGPPPAWHYPRPSGSERLPHRPACPPGPSFRGCGPSRERHLRRPHALSRNR